MLCWVFWWFEWCHISIWRCCWLFALLHFVLSSWFSALQSDSQIRESQTRGFHLERRSKTTQRQCQGYNATVKLVIHQCIIRPEITDRTPPTDRVPPKKSSTKNQQKGSSNSHVFFKKQSERWGEQHTDTFPEAPQPRFQGSRSVPACWQELLGSGSTAGLRKAEKAWPWVNMKALKRAKFAEPVVFWRRLVILLIIVCWLVPACQMLLPRPYLW